MSTLVDLLKRIEGNAEARIEKLRTGRFRIFEVSVNGESADRTAEHLKACNSALMDIRRAVEMVEGHAG